MKNILRIAVALLSLMLCCGLLMGYAYASQDVSYQRNENGETYGSGMLSSSASVRPDLMLAEGDSGIIGYVRTSELQKDDDTLSTVLEELAEGKQNVPYTIPVYEEDGITVIDTFTVGGSSIGSNSELARSDWAESDPWTNTDEDNKGTFTAYIKSGWFKVTGKAHVRAHQPMRTGGLGAQVFIFNENGVIVSSSTMEYSKSAVTEFYTTHSYNGDAGVNYYAEGSLRIWVEELEVYWTFGTYRTPYVTPSVA